MFHQFTQNNGFDVVPFNIIQFRYCNKIGTEKYTGNTFNIKDATCEWAVASGLNVREISSGFIYIL
jgi:hypothetical protein